MSDDIFEVKTVTKEIIKTVVVSKSLFGLSLAEARNAKGLTLVEVGKHFGSGYSRIVNWETGTASPLLKDFIKLCRLYDVTPNDLLGF